MKKIICTTTINAPTEALLRFDAMSDWELVVAGDRKTPSDFKLKRGHYFTIHEQEMYDKALSDAIGYNCIQRRNFAFLLAVKELNADVIATIDDDNIPYDHWGNLLFDKPVTATEFITEQPVFDPVSNAGAPKLWHRGFPLKLLRGRWVMPGEPGTICADIQADFWNGDPDVDAICRMEHSPDCQFDPNRFPLFSKTISPFNSQNTFLKRDVMPHYFMFPHVGRFDDILASYYAQACGFKVVYGRPSVIQKRNPHNLMKDFENEVWGQSHIMDIISVLKRDTRGFSTMIPARAEVAFNLYQKHF